MSQIRTAITKPQQCKRTGMWSSVFEQFRSHSGEEYLISTVTSAPVFHTEDDALAGANRALDALGVTGRYPNMCEAF